MRFVPYATLMLFAIGLAVPASTEPDSPAARAQAIAEKLADEIDHAIDHANLTVASEPSTPHIAIGDKYELGQKIVAEFIGQAVAGGTESLTWTASAGVEVEQVGRKLYVWAPQGKHTLTLDASYTLQVLTPGPKFATDPTDIQQTTLVLPPYRYVATFQVGPATPPNPPPGPDPPDPPAPGTLGALVPDPAHRALLAEFYADFASVVRSGVGATVAEFYAAQRKAVDNAQAAGKLPKGLAAINKPISDRITAALGGTQDGPLDAAKRTALAIALDSIAAEFK